LHNFTDKKDYFLGSGKLRKIYKLILTGANANIKDQRSRTPLIIVAMQNYNSIIPVFIILGANINYQGEIQR